MNLQIITPGKTIFEGEVTGVQMNGVNGSFEILNGHSPLVSVLNSGKVRVTNQKEVLFFEIDGGVVEVLNNNVSILAESAN